MSNDLRHGADWERVESVYQQCLRCLTSTGHHIPEVLPPFLAELFARQSVMYQGVEKELLHDGLEVLLRCHGSSLDSAYFDRDQVFPSAYHDGEAASGRRRPLPAETFLETTRRLRDLTELEHQLSEVTVGGVLGGSMSYGRFFNVRGSRDGDPSDLDLLVVVESPRDCERVIKRIADVPGIAIGFARTGLDRFSTFLAGTSTGEVEQGTLFSHKFGLWQDQADEMLDGVDIGHGYSLSVHIMPQDTFDRTILRHYPKVEKQHLGEAQLVNDFRETEPSREDKQRCFSGEQRDIPIEFREYKGSYVRQTHLFFIDESDRYYPGMVQNLILPGFDVVWGRRDFRRQIDMLRWKMVERLRTERRIRPDDVLRLSFSHTRSNEFAPYIIRSIDSSTLVP